MISTIYTQQIQGFVIFLEPIITTHIGAIFEVGISWVRVPVESNQMIKLVFVASPLSTKH